MVQRDKAKWFRQKMLDWLGLHGMEPILVGLPIQYKPEWVEKEVGFDIISAPVFGNGERTYICSEEEWLVFDEKFPTVAHKVDLDAAHEQLESMCQ